MCGYRSYILNKLLKGADIEYHIGSMIGVIKVDTRSFDHTFHTASSI